MEPGRSCRTYGALFVGQGYPVLTHWANLLRASGAEICKDLQSRWSQGA
jgi:hypothetical protein